MDKKNKRIKMEIKTEWEKYEYLFDHVTTSPTSRDDRDRIIMLGIYSEYITNYLMISKNLVNSSKKITSQAIKLKLLHELEELTNDQFEVLSKLNKIRNQFAHNLELSDDKIKKVSTLMSDTKDLHFKGELDNKFHYHKFKGSCITVIGQLMKKIATLKNQEFQPLDSKNIQTRNVHIVLYCTYIQTYLNSIIDRGMHTEISINDLRKILNNGNIIDFLEEKFPKDMDFSHFNKSTRKEVNELVRDYFDGYHGDEWRKFGIKNYGLSLLPAYLIGIIQQELRGFIHPKEEPPKEFPKIV